ncbi:hypothetical protein DFH06DRAFT_1130774 [Mycena polygramma]|nr:hypothetical protein DFH06DRAFT_1130774 [Mycena polygramma]
MAVSPHLHGDREGETSQDLSSPQGEDSQAPSAQGDRAAARRRLQTPTVMRPRALLAFSARFTALPSVWPLHIYPADPRPLAISYGYSKPYLNPPANHLFNARVDSDVASLAPPVSVLIACSITRITRTGSLAHGTETDRPQDPAQDLRATPAVQSGDMRGHACHEPVHSRTFAGAAALGLVNLGPESHTANLVAQYVHIAMQRNKFNYLVHMKRELNILEAKRMSKKDVRNSETRTREYLNDGKK